MGNDDKTYLSLHSSFSGHLSPDYNVHHEILLLAGEVNPSGFSFQTCLKNGSHNVG